MSISDLSASVHESTDRIFDLKDELDKGFVVNTLSRESIAQSEESNLKRIAEIKSELDKWIKIKVLAKAKLLVAIEEQFLKEIKL